MRKRKREQRLEQALLLFDEVTEQAEFERLRVRLCDDAQHWLFEDSEGHVASYWPASSKLLLKGQSSAKPCRSAVRAVDLAIAHRRLLRGDPAPEVRDV